MTAKHRVERPLLALTAGDPCGIGPEVVLAALSEPALQRAARLLVIGDQAVLRECAKQLKLRWPFVKSVTRFERGMAEEKPLLLDLGGTTEGLRAGQISSRAGRAAARAVEVATELGSAKQVDAIVTAPICKESLALAGYSDLGHTEMLARLTGVRKVGMLFWYKKLSVALLTTHLSLRDAARAVRRPRILAKLELFDREWRRLFGKPPRIAVAGLNPHAGEAGRFGVEETREIVPAMEDARGRGISCAGPFSADSIFRRAAAGEFDLVLAMYHDQGTIPIKILGGYDAVNITVGLPFVRTSVDHGTAMEIAGKGIADPRSMIQATLLAAKLAARK